MNVKKLFSIVAIALAICISVPHRVNAAGATPTTTSSVRGTVHYEGKVPLAKPISMAADPVCAKQHPSPLMAQEIMADSKGDLENVVVFVVGGPGRSEVRSAQRAGGRGAKGMHVSAARDGSAGESETGTGQRRSNLAQHSSRADQQS